MASDCYERVAVERVEDFRSIKLIGRKGSLQHLFLNCCTEHFDKECSIKQFISYLIISEFKMSNKYIVLVTGTKDSLGFDFMRNVVALANKGAVLQEGKVPFMRFPHQAFMYFETEELMENTPGLQFQRIQELYTKEQLDEMEWDLLKMVVKRDTGLTGRNRDLLTKQYLKSINSAENV